LKVTPSCIACVIARRAGELELLYGDGQNRMRLSVLRNLIESMLLYVGPDIEAAELATVTFRRMKSLARVEKLYENLIERYREMAMMRAKDVEEMTGEMDDVEAVKLLAKVAAMATGFRVLHAGRVLEEPPGYTLAISVKPARDDSERLLKLLEDIRGTGTVYYLFRGALELPYDIAFIRRLRSAFELKVVGVVKSGRFEDHATLADLEEYGYMDELDDVIEYASDAASLLQDEADHIVSMLDEADLVIVKGGLQSLHIENLGVKRPRLKLLMVNCGLLSRRLNVKLASVNIILDGVEEGPRQG